MQIYFSLFFKKEKILRISLDFNPNYAKYRRELLHRFQKSICIWLICAQSAPKKSCFRKKCVKNKFPEEVTPPKSANLAIAH